MKFGLRKPNLKKSIKARTTGKAKRAVKRAINPTYGKKGMGYVNDPKKAVYNKVYNKTTVGIGDIGKGANGEDLDEYETYEELTKEEIIEIKHRRNIQKKVEDKYSAKMYKVTGICLFVFWGFIALCGLFVLPIGLIFIGLGLLFIPVGRDYLKIAKLKKERQVNDEVEETEQEKKGE